MEVRHLASLIAIAEHGSFSAAARALGTVQSNVSAHISRLEKDLGVTLVDRHNGSLTEEGAVVVERGRRIIHDLQDIEADIHSTDTVVEGETRLGCLGTTGRWLMPTLLPALAAAHPKVRATVYEGGTSNLIPRLLAGDLDAAIVHFPIQDPELFLEPLFSEDMVLLVHNRFEWAAHTPRNTELRRIVDRAAGNQRIALTPQAEIDGVRLLASLAIDGFGPAIVPATAIPKWLTGDFAIVALPELPKRMVGWATRRRPVPNKPTRALLDVTKAAVVQAGEQQPGVTTDQSLMLPARNAAR
jgi:LysR family hydrogen peroxide-inducible transcriptional activator